MSIRNFSQKHKKNLTDHKLLKIIVWFLCCCHHVFFHLSFILNLISLNNTFNFKNCKNNPYKESTSHLICLSKQNTMSSYRININPPQIILIQCNIFQNLHKNMWWMKTRVVWMRDFNQAGNLWKAFQKIWATTCTAVGIFMTHSIIIFSESFTWLLLKLLQQLFYSFPKQSVKMCVGCIYNASWPSVNVAVETLR